jgi:hypothetical protein
MTLYRYHTKIYFKMYLTELILDCIYVFSQKNLLNLTYFDLMKKTLFIETEVVGARTLQDKL